MKAFINAWCEQYNSERYPIDFYYKCIKKIHTTNDSKEFARCVIAMLHWKDGKVSPNNMGDFFIDGVMYSLGRPKPNTYTPIAHKHIIESIDFFDWGKTFINQRDFDINQLNKLKGIPFMLYSANALVIPSFILHILSPTVYPLYDQHVERARRALNAEKHLNSDSTSLSVDSYSDYKIFLDTVLLEYYGSRTNLPLEGIKEVDSALWSFGKWLKDINKGNAASIENSINVNQFSANLPTVNESTLLKRVKGTFEPDHAFKQRVMQLTGQGYTQAKAIQTVANERNVKLADSYYKYPGSHINRWRQQGF